MWTQHFLAFFHPFLHVWSSLVDVTVGYPVLGHLPKETKVCYRDLVTGYKLPVFQEVVFDDVKGRPQFSSQFRRAVIKLINYYICLLSVSQQHIHSHTLYHCELPTPAYVTLYHCFLLYFSENQSFLDLHYLFSTECILLLCTQI